MKKIKTIAPAFLSIITIAFIALSCKREDAYPGYEKNAAKFNAVSQNLSAAGCKNEDVEKHFISLQYAYQLIHKFQETSKTPGALCDIMGENGWVYFESFPAEAISRILTQRGCCKFRVYNGLGEDNRLHFVMVGVNEYGFDYLKCNERSESNDSCKNINDLPLIVEMGAPCPEACSGGSGRP
jgi:hypothetical protein